MAEIVDHDVTANHRTRLERQSPRIRDSHRGENNDFRWFRNLRSEDSEQPRAKAVQRARTPAKQRCLDEGPEPSEQDFLARIWRDAILPEIRWFLRHAAGLRKHYRCTSTSKSQARCAIPPSGLPLPKGLAGDSGFFLKNAGMATDRFRSLCGALPESAFEIPYSPERSRLH